MARSAQTHKSISFIWIVWSTLYVYLWPRALFYRTDCTRRYKFLTHALFDTFLAGLASNWVYGACCSAQADNKPIDLSQQTTGVGAYCPNSYTVLYSNNGPVEIQTMDRSDLLICTLNYFFVRNQWVQSVWVRWITRFTFTWNCMYFYGKKGIFTKA